MFTSRDFLRALNITFYQRTLLGTSANQKRYYLKSYNTLMYYVKMVVVLLQINAKFILHRTGYMHEISAAGCYTNTTIALVAIVSITIL